MSTANVSRNELFFEIRSLKETLNVTLEFKRLLDHLFKDQRLKNSGLLTPYFPHYFEYRRKYQLLRGAFHSHLLKNLDRIDCNRLVRCGSLKCKLSSCNEPMDLPFDWNSDEVKMVDSDDNDKNNNTKSEDDPPSSGIERNLKTYVVKKCEPKQDEPEVMEVNDDVEEMEQGKVVEDKSQGNNSNGTLAPVEDTEISKSEELNDSKVEERISKHSDIDMDTLKPTAITEDKNTISSTDYSQPANSHTRTATDPQPEQQLSSPSSPKPSTSTTDNQSETLNVHPAPQVAPILEGPKSPQVITITDSPDHPKEQQSQPEKLSEPSITIVSSLETHSPNNFDQTIPVPPEQTTQESVSEQQQQQRDKPRVLTKKFPCKVEDCDETFDTISAATAHFRAHTKLLRCSECSFLYSERFNLNRHFRMHSEEKERLALLAKSKEN